MTADATPTDRHPPDGDLVRLVDGEDDTDDVRDHVEACDRCRSRLRRLRRRSDGLSRLLEATDPLVRTSATGAHGGADDRIGADRGDDGRGDRGARWIPRRRWTRIAAGVALLLAGGMAIQPVRAWVVDRARDVVERLRSGGAEDGGSLPDAGGTSVAFVPEESELSIHVEHAQMAGALELVASADRRQVEASIGRAESGGSASLEVLPSGLRIRNERSSSTSYRVIVPSSLAEVRVRIADRPTARVAGEELRRGRNWSWALGPGP